MKIFVAMPLGKKEFPGVRHAIRAAANTHKMTCVFPDEIEHNSKITQDICDEIRSSNIIIIDITRNNANVMWEYGFASAIGKTIIPITQSSKYIAFDFKDDRAIIYSLSDLGTSLTQTLSLRLGNSTFRNLPYSDLVGTRRYKNSSPIMGLDSLDGTQLGIFDLLKISKTSIVMVAQNHGFVANSPQKFKLEIFKFLKRLNTYVYIIMCNPKFEHAVKTWQYVTDKAYDIHLHNAANTFDELERSVQLEFGGGRLRLIKLEFVPVSINFVDPEEADGFAVISPNVMESKGRERPAFVVSKANSPTIFNKYWSGILYQVEHQAKDP